MKEIAYILLAAALAYFASLAAGRVLFRFLKLALARSEERFLGFLAGSSLLSLCVFLLGAVHLAYKGVFIVLGVALIVAGYVLRRPAARLLPPLPPAWRIVFWLGFAAYLYVYVPCVLAPEVSPDGTAYHVGLIAQYYRAHRIEWLTNSIYADLSQGVEMLFLFAYGIASGLGRGSAAACVHFLYLLVLPFGMISYARRFGMPAAGVVGALLFFMAPVVGKSGTSAYNDVAVAAVLFGVFYALQIWNEERTPKLLALAGLLAGFAYGVKYTAFLAIPYALVYCWIKARSMRAPLLTGACALIMVAPWVIRNSIVVGDPFAPFANAWFRNPYVHVSFETKYRQYMAHFNEVAYRDIPVEVTIRGDRLFGILGPVFLLSPLALFALRNRYGRRLLLAGAIFGITYFTNTETRFLIAPLPFLALALGLTLSYWKGMGPLVVAAHALFSWPAMVNLYCGQYAWRIPEIPWKVALRRSDAGQYIAANLGDAYSMCALIKKTVPPGQPVYVTGGFPRSYSDHDIVALGDSAFGQRMLDAITSALYDSSGPTWRHDFKFPARTITHIRVRQTASSDVNPWSIFELRVFRSGRELPRGPQWRLRAWPNPWDVQLAFDNNPVTRWSSWECHWPGMYVDVDFGAAVEIDEVVAECSPNQEQMRMVLEGLPANDVTSHVPMPEGARRAAIAYLKSSGVHWLVIDKDNWAAKDFVVNRAEWGVKAAAHTQELILYRLD